MLSGRWMPSVSCNLSFSLTGLWLTHFFVIIGSNSEGWNFAIKAATPAVIMELIAFRIMNSILFRWLSRTCGFWWMRNLEMRKIFSILCISRICDELRLLLIWNYQIAGVDVRLRWKIVHKTRPKTKNNSNEPRMILLAPRSNLSYLSQTPNKQEQEVRLVQQTKIWSP